MTTLKSFKTLLWAKGRRLESLQAQAAHTLQQQQLAYSAWEQAQADYLRHDSQERLGRDKLDATLAAECFRPETLLVLSNLHNSLQAQSAAAGSAMRGAEQTCHQRGTELAKANTKVQRARSQLDTLAQRRLELERQLAQADEDQQDEESEESAVARRLNARLAQMRVAAGLRRPGE